ncbi:substrate-binding domain-containing protein [Sphingomonas gellani]|nr:substrate-binding domain-containing protein [Sphingomonas gellani]
MARRLLQTLFPLGALVASVTACHDQALGGMGGRDSIAAVGSSTVYPFTTTVAELYVATHPHAAAPVIEETGTGAGLRLFCAGIGSAFPDIADASRRMRADEYRACARNGAGALVEVQLGLDGIAIGRSRAGPAIALTPAQIYRALAAAPGGRPNTARRWSDVDPALPDSPITVYGPPATSGTRDAFGQLILLPGCRAAERRATPACLRIREDGAYVDAGESDNAIVQKLSANPAALGVFGFSYLAENADSLAGVPINGIAPDRPSIATGRYPGARPLFLYVKKAHLDAVPGLHAFLDLYARSWGKGGPLARHGLIPAPAAVQARGVAALRGETLLNPAELS